MEDSKDAATPQGVPPQGVPLIEGWLLGQMLFPFAMELVQRIPPANDRD